MKADLWLNCDTLLLKQTTAAELIIPILVICPNSKRRVEIDKGGFNEHAIVIVIVESYAKLILSLTGNKNAPSTHSYIQVNSKIL